MCRKCPYRLPLLDCSQWKWKWCETGERNKQINQSIEFEYNSGSLSSYETDETVDGRRTENAFCSDTNRICVWIITSCILFFSSSLNSEAKQQQQHGNHLIEAFVCHTVHNKIRSSLLELMVTNKLIRNNKWKKKYKRMHRDWQMHDNLADILMALRVSRIDSTSIFASIGEKYHKLPFNTHAFNWMWMILCWFCYTCWLVEIHNHVTKSNQILVDTFFFHLIY